MTSEEEQALAAYETIITEVASAAKILEAAEPTMALLIDQVRNAEDIGVFLDPTLAQRVIGNRNVELQVKLAKEVVAFVRTWREIRDEAFKDLGKRLDRLSDEDLQRLARGEKL